MPVGGQTNPISPAGFKEKWKKVQKNLKKSIISEKMNRTIPSLSAAWVFWVCEPKKADSRDKSRVHA